MKAKDVLQQMNEIEQTVYATQSWWPQLRRLLEQAEAAEASHLTPVAADGACISTSGTFWRHWFGSKSKCQRCGQPRR